MEQSKYELWAFCDPCNRWFFVPLRPDGVRPAPEEHRITCPVCIAPAGRFEGRRPNGDVVALDGVDLAAAHERLISPS